MPWDGLLAVCPAKPELWVHWQERTGAEFTAFAAVTAVISPNSLQFEEAGGGLIGW